MNVFKPARTERSRIPCTSRPGVDQVLATTKNEEGHFRDPPRISLICFRNFGAGEGIRTPDPNLGKVASKGCKKADLLICTLF